MDVIGPKQTPPRVSLISAAETLDAPAEHWAQGFNAELDGQGGASVFPVCPEEAAQKTFNTSGGFASFKPYVLYATDKISNYGTVDRDFYGRAQRKLVAGESSALENILWKGYTLAANQNPFLADGAGDYLSDTVGYGVTETSVPTMTITSGVTAVKDALAVLEQTMGEASASRGMIHIRPIAFHALVEEAVVRREGNVWLTPMDNIIVPGRGYPGTGPSGQAVGDMEWMYGHAGIVQVRRGEIVRLGENDIASTIDRYTNDRSAIVERTAHVLLDPTVQVYAIDFESLGNYSSIPSIAFTGLDVTASNTDNVATEAIYGWNLVNGGGAAASITITLTPAENIVINLAAGESVTYMLPSPISTTDVAYTSGAGITGTIFVAV